MLLQERQDGIVEIQLFVRKTRLDSFRHYTLFVENKIGSSSKIVELEQSKIYD